MSTIQIVEDIFSRTELDCQQKKTDRTTLDEWERYSPKYSSPLNSDSFESIESRIQMYLLFKPHQADSLLEALQRESISINIEWLQSNFSNSRWQRFVRAQSKIKWLRDGWKAAFLDNEASIVNKCVVVCKSMLADYSEVIQEHRPNSKTAAKWQAKRIGYLALRLAQLSSSEELNYLTTSVSDFDLPSVTAILQDLQRKVIRSSLPFPGSAINFLCAQWNSSGWEPPVIEIEDKPALYSALSAITQIPVTIANTQVSNSEENYAAILLRWIVEQPGYPQAPLETFERELQCIINGQNFNDTRKTIQRTRFSDGEAVDGSSFALEVISSLQSG